MRVCVNCGKRLFFGEKECGACGAEQPGPDAGQNEKTRKALIGVLIGASLLAAGAAVSLLGLPQRLFGRMEKTTVSVETSAYVYTYETAGTLPAQTEAALPAETDTAAAVQPSAAAEVQTATVPSAVAAVPETGVLVTVTVPVQTTAGAAADITQPPAVPAAPDGAVPAYETVNGLLLCGNAAFEYYNFSRSVADNYAAAVNRAAQLLAGRAQVYAMVIPTGIDIALDPRVRAKISSGNQQEACAYLEGSFSPLVRAVPVFGTLLSHRNEYLYFRTDHHWTGLAAYYAYVEFCRAKGVQPVELAACTRRDFAGFLGTYYASSGKRAALGNTPDVVETYMPPGDTLISVYNDSGRSQYRGSVIFNEEHNGAANKYGAFIFGDNAFSVIENRSLGNGAGCLLVKDSFGNAIAPLLAAHYQYVYVMDFRYCSKTVSQLVSEYGIGDVLFADNLSMTRAAKLVNQLAAKIG